MKIVHILPGKANPDRMNGVNKVVHQLAVAQAGLGYDVTVCGLASDTFSKDERPYELQLFRQNPRSFIIKNELQNFLTGLHGRSVVHFHGVLNPAYYSLAILLQKNGIRYVVTPHGALQPMSLKKRKLLKSAYIFLFERKFLSDALKLHAITSFEKDVIQKIIKSKIIVIPNAAPDVRFEDRKEENREIIFTYTGRLSRRHKGLDALIEGFALFYKKHGQGQLHLIGDGEDRHWLERKAEECNIIFHGEHHGQSKKELLEKADMFIYPSRWDVLPTAILEAASFNKPVITTEATGFAENIRKYRSGIVIDQADPLMITNAMEQAYQCKTDLRKEMGRNAGNMVANEYNLSKITADILQNLYGLQ